MKPAQQSWFGELKTAGLLPSPPGVALQILRLSEDDMTSIATISHILETDPAIAGRILKLSNSALSGSNRRITSLREAVTRLGVRAVRNTALCFSVISKSGAGSCKEFDYPRYWSRSLATAVAAQILSTRFQNLQPDEAFTCGLLCKVGCLALASVHPQDYGAILALHPQATPPSLAPHERERFAIDHNEMTAALLDDWGLPENYVTAIRHHEQPATLRETPALLPLARLIDLAGALADICVADGNRRQPLFSALFAKGQDADIPHSDLLALGDRLIHDWHEWGKVLDVATTPLPSFAEMAERAETDAVEVCAAVVPADTPLTPAGSEPSEPMEPATPARKLTILIVDDDPVERRFITEQLIAAGHAAPAAADGHEALRVLLDTHPQMVLAHLKMPGMGGDAFCKALRQSKIGQLIYLIMFAESADETQLVDALEAGADDFLEKPLRPRTMLARIRAGQRVIRLQQEVIQDREELQRYTSELAVLNRKLQQAALTDPLTELPNRRYAMSRLDQEWANATRHGKALACMIADIDHFKQINDVHGHDIGDCVIRATARMMAETLRKCDVVCRIGGEEFLVICPETNGDAARLCAERLRRAIADHVIQDGAFQRNITLSIGVAARQEKMPLVEKMLKAADEALYCAKQSGRNRVCVAGAG